MNDNEASQLIDDMLLHAQGSYYLGKSNLSTEILECISNPDYIQDKKIALDICNALVSLCLAGGLMETGYLTHIFGLRLYDYINRKIP